MQILKEEMVSQHSQEENTEEKIFGFAVDIQFFDRMSKPVL